MEPHMIWSLPRCASTSLMSLVTACGSTCADEPFSNQNFQAPYQAQATEGKLDVAMEDILEKWNGFKHCAHPSGWPFPDTRRYLNERILMWPGVRVVFLKRNNMLKQVVSTMIAQQCGQWHCKAEEDLSKRESFPFRPLDMERIEFCLRNNTKFNEVSESLLADTGKPFFKVTTEVLFASDKNTRLGTAIALLHFLGLNWPDNDTLDKLTTQEPKQFSKSIYSKVPEIEEVERRFASLEHGSLLT